MTDKYTNEQVIDSIADDGIGYCITAGFSAEYIADPVLAKLWQEASDALGVTYKDGSKIGGNR